MEEYSEVFVWGLDNCGQLGLGTTTCEKKYSTPIFCSFNILIYDLSCGEDHTGFISDLGHVYCMGSNLNGKLGISSKHQLNSSSPILVESLLQYTATKISCGWTHTAVITKDQKLFTWGCGEFGALGTGGVEDAWEPVEVFNNVQDVSCGARHTGIISKGLGLMCGAGEMGQLGNGRRGSEYRFCEVRVERAVQVACGVFHTGFVSGNGEVWIMGGNSYGQLGIGNKKSAVLPVKVAVRDAIRLFCNSSSMCIAADGVYIWGTSILGEFLTPKKLKVSSCPIIDAALGGSFALVMDSKGNIFSWGTNQNGELGLNDFDSRPTPTLIPSLKNKRLKKILAGGNFAICLGQENMEKKPTKRAEKTSSKTARDPKVPQINIQQSLAENEKKNDYWAIKQENLKLKESLAWYKNQVDNEKPKLFEETFQQLKESYMLEIKSLKFQLESQSSLQKDLESDLQVAISHTYRLEESLTEAQSQLSTKNIQNLKQDYHALEDQNMNLKFLLENCNLQVQELQTVNSSMSQENNYLKQSLNDLSQESMKLTRFVTELQASIDSLNTLIQTQEIRLQQLSSENSELKSETLKLHSKNEEIIHSFERDISHRAQIFKDKTLGILNYSKSRNLTPEDKASKTSRNELSSGQRDRIKNAVNKIIDTESVSPIQTVSPDRSFRLIHSEFHGKTPSRGDVQNKIKGLIQNRSRIEEKMMRLNQEQDSEFFF